MRICVKWDGGEAWFIWSPSLPCGVAALEAARFFGATKEKEEEARFHPREQTAWSLIGMGAGAPFIAHGRLPLSAIAKSGGEVYLGRGA